MRTRAGAVLMGLVLLSAGCATPGSPTAAPTPVVNGDRPSGTVAATPAAGAPGSTPSGSAATTSPTPSGTPRAGPLMIVSPDFAGGAAIPRRFTCDGDNVSPGLTWSGAPDGTRSLALTVRDPDAGGFVHWLAFDIPGTPTGGLQTGVSGSALAPAEGTNGFGRRGWGGPCPPSGTHHYVFTLFALDRSLGLSGAPRVGALEAAMRGHVLGQTTLTATYRRR